ncbi:MULTISPECIES: hypothetical protein [Sphingobacterium]|uniref:hypothetical protein n=1 Tax=Sphingobacterium TaxID=28453 RepID=UPI0008A48F37|nr:MULTISPECIES: hypothetical protein [Sphingobacterium]OFV21792.1 hypothetical protein HMPREF3127_00250 [Sphingobacterium sp. HMSC13C05]HAL54168.1 hypothetical protein [Sphingobacterium sp.]
MKKMKISVMNVQDVLSREEMKKMVGGLGSHTPGSMCSTQCGSESKTHTCSDGIQCSGVAGTGIYCGMHLAVSC